MINLLILLLEVFLIFSTSQYIFKAFFIISYLTFKSKKVAIGLLSFFFLPGVIIHELSHLFSAEILRVKTHGIEFFPELQDGQLKMGSVQVEQSDFFRQFLIGVAPFISGMTIIIALFYFISPYISVQNLLSSYLSVILSVCFLYIIFVITNTMFSSKKDMEGALELTVVFIILVVICFIAGIHLDKLLASFLQIQNIQNMVNASLLFLLVPLGLNLLSALIASVVLSRKGIRILK